MPMNYSNLDFEVRVQDTRKAHNSKNQTITFTYVSVQRMTFAISLHAKRFKVYSLVFTSNTTNIPYNNSEEESKFR